MQQFLAKLIGVFTHVISELIDEAFNKEGILRISDAPKEHNRYRKILLHKANINVLKMVANILRALSAMEVNATLYLTINEVRPGKQVLHPG